MVQWPLQRVCALGPVLPSLQVVLQEHFTYQAKASNRVQVQSLVARVASLLPSRCVILDLGAGKALFSRALYEAFGRSQRA